MHTAARIYKMWRDHAGESLAAAAAPVGRERCGRSGRPPRLTTELGKRIIALQREHHVKASEKTLCGLLAEEGHKVAPSTMHRWCTALDMHVFTCSLQPKLSLNHKIQRLKHVLGQLEMGPDGQGRFRGWHQSVHVDEKWVIPGAGQASHPIGPFSRRGLRATDGFCPSHVTDGQGVVIVSCCHVPPRVWLQRQEWAQAPSGACARPSAATVAPGQSKARP